MTKEVTIKTGKEIAIDCSHVLQLTNEEIDAMHEAEKKEWADLEELKEKVRLFKRYRHNECDFVSDNVTMVNCTPLNRSSFQDWLFSHYFSEYLEVKNANRKNEKETENRFNTGRLRNPS